MEKRSAEITALVERARKGDKTASAELYEKMYDKLYFFALKNVRSKEDAEDIVQEAFMKALESLGELNSSESFSGWIYSVTYNLCIDKMRGGKRVARFETEDDRDNAIENSALNEPVMVPEDYMQNEETKRQIKDVIDGLRPDMRSAVILYYYDQMSIAEIAETMNLSESSVKSKLYQARKKIKTKLEKLGVDRSVTVHMSLVPIPALIALVADELDTSAAVVASPFGKAAVTVTVGVTVLGAAAAMAFFANVHKGDMRIDSGIDSAESTVSIYTEEQSSANSLGESVLTSSLGISSMAPNSASDSRAVSADTSTQSNYDSYVDTPNNNFTPNTPDTSSDNTASSSSASSSSKADSSSSSDDDDFPKFDYIELDDGTIKLVDFTGNWVDGGITPSVVVIPEEYKGKKITVIGSRFMSSEDCSDGVEEVVIPDSVTTIETDAFSSQEDSPHALKKIHIGKNVEKIEAGAFSMNRGGECCKTKMTIDPDNKWYTIYDDGLYTKDLTEVFWYPSTTEEVHFPDTLKVIHTSTFGGCLITEIDIPYGVTELETETFYNCINLKRIGLPNSLKIIGSRAVYDCPLPTEIAIPYSVKEIGNYFFLTMGSPYLFTKVLFAADAKIDLESQNFDYIYNFPEIYKANSQEEWYALYEQHFK